MYWPDTGTGVDTEPARKPVASAVRKYFTEGGAGVPPTVPGGDWFNAITNEVLNVLDAAGIDPSKADDDQLLQAIHGISKAMSAREALRRSYVEAGLPPAGWFEDGCTVTTTTQVALFGADGKGYSWAGAMPKSVPAKSSPASSGGIGPTAWVDQSNKTLRRKIVILATGQSNVAQEPAYDWTPPSNVFVWAWPGLGATGSKFIPCPTAKVNHTYACAAELARLNPNWDVYIVKIASSGRPIDHWLPGGSSTTLPEWNAYEDCKNNTEAALAALGLTTIDYFHWHQGESDITNIGSYTTKWKQVFDRFCGETWFKRNTRVLINGVTSTAIKGDPNYAQMNMKLRSIVRDSPSLRTFVPTAEIVPLDLWLADGLHMSGEGHLFLGTAEAQTLQFGGALPVPQGYAYDPETGNVCLGGATPAAGGTVEVNKGSMPSGLSYNARTSLDVINTQTDAGDLVSLRAIGANGAYSVTGYAQGALANSVRMEWTGTSQMQHAITSSGAYKYYCGSTEVLSVQNALIRAGTDATVFAGNASFRFKTIYLETAPVVTSDERMKSPPKPIDDAVLDAWADVGFWQYRMLSSVEKEGDGALIHFGVIAQRVIEAFAAHGLNALQYGLIRHDRWDDSPAEYQLLPAEYNEDGELVCEERTILVSPEIAAGDRYSIIYDEALIVEAELQRRNYQRLQARIEALETN